MEIVKTIEKVRIIETCESMPSWRSRLVWGSLWYACPTTCEQIGKLTGLDRRKTIPAILTQLRSSGMVNEWVVNERAYGLPRHKAGNGHWFIPYSWVGVRSDQCPLTAEQNVFYWLYWSKIDRSRSLKQLSRLVGLPPQTVRRMFSEMESKGAAVDDGMLPPDELTHWWEAKKPTLRNAA